MIFDPHDHFTPAIIKLPTLRLVNSTPLPPLIYVIELEESILLVADVLAYTHMAISSYSMLLSFTCNEMLLDLGALCGKYLLEIADPEI